MSVSEKDVQEAISNYLKQPVYNPQDKKWYIEYVDLNTEEKYNTRFYTKEEAQIWYKERYNIIYKFMMNIIARHSSTGR